MHPTRVARQSGGSASGAVTSVKRRHGDGAELGERRRLDGERTRVVESSALAVGCTISFLRSRAGGPGAASRDANALWSVGCASSIGDIAAARFVDTLLTAA